MNMEQTEFSVVKGYEDEELKFLENAVMRLAERIKNQNPLLTGITIRVIREYNDGMQSCDVLTA